MQSPRSRNRDKMRGLSQRALDSVDTPVDTNEAEIP